MKNIAVCDRFIGRKPGRCYSMGVSHPEAFAAGTNLVLNSAEAPLTALSLYGWSKQDGTPSPENPVPIVSAGDEGEINVTVQGGNLVDESQLKQGYIGDDSGEITATDDVKYRSFVINVAPGEYTLSSNVNLLNVRVLRDGTNSTAGTSITPEKPYTLSVAKSGLFGMSFRRSDSEPWDDSIKIMLNSGSTPLPYEPYKPLQTLTVQTPNGLPGIPVTASSLPDGVEPTYTDESGQAWICDEVDFKRGKYVQRVCKYIIDDLSNISFVIVGEHNRFSINAAPPAMANGAGYCDHFTVSKIPIINNATDGQISCYVSGGVYLRYDACTSVEELKTWLADNPVIYYYPLAEPIETDLTTEEIAAYKALHTYSPATTVSNDAGAWMKVGYYGLTAIQKLEKEALMINGGKT